MNMTQLRGLIALAAAGSVTAAAERIGVTQSALSQSLAALEDELGVKLLVRQRHGVTLTAFGERALGHAHAAFTHIEALRKAAAAAKGEDVGPIRIAAFPSVFAKILPPLIRRFRLLHPDITVTLLETDDREGEEWIRAGSVDLGVVLNAPPENGAILIGQDAWVVVLPVSHPLGWRTTFSLVDLAAQPFVLATGGCHLHAGRLMEEAGLSLLDVRMEVRDWASAIALVREGEGVALVPESTLPENRKGLKVVGLNPPIYRRFGLMAAPDRAPSRPVSLFLDLARRLAEGGSLNSPHAR